MKIALIAAMSRNRVIGKDGKIPWHIPQDMKYFRRITKSGMPIVMMGRNTWDSIGNRPLPGRFNYVVSEVLSEYTGPGGHLVVTKMWKVMDGINSAKRAEKESGNVSPNRTFIIGGQQMYQRFLPIADEIFLTTLSADYEGDTYFPSIPFDEWTVTHKRHYTKQGQCYMSHYKYERIHG